MLLSSLPVKSRADVPGVLLVLDQDYRAGLLEVLDAHFLQTWQHCLLRAC